MTLLLSKRILVASLILCCSFAFAQQKIKVKYYENNIEASIENVRILLVTKTDTIVPKVEEGKIRISSKIKDNFSVFAQIGGRTMLIGSYRPAAFKEFDALIFGRITDFSVLKKHWEKNNTYFIDNQYIIEIPNSSNMTVVVYATTKKDINDSGISNYIVYKSKFTTIYEVIATKN